MTYPVSPHYFSLEDDDQPTVNTVKLTEDETGRVFALAEIWASRCVERGITPPPDPLRALLAAAENLYQTVCALDALHERAEIEANGGVLDS